MLKLLCSYLVWLLRYQHLNKHTVVKFERDIKITWKENDVKIIIFSFNDVLKMLNLKNSFNALFSSENRIFGTIYVHNIMMQNIHNIKVLTYEVQLCKLNRSKGKYVTYSSYIWASFNKMLIEHKVMVVTKK